MTEIVWRSRGYLPHLDAPDLVQHVIFRLADSIFRLADSLPSHVLQEIGRVPKSVRPEAANAALDRGYGRRDLAAPPIGELVQQALLRFDAERYRLIAWCVMPNHVHVLFEISAGHALDRVVHAWKSFTAHAANRILGRQGAVWAPEYFDRYMRDERHLGATIAYIEGNPVKAGLCENAADWPFSSAASKLGGRDARGPK